MVYIFWTLYVSVHQRNIYVDFSETGRLWQGSLCYEIYNLFRFAKIVVPVVRSEKNDRQNANV